MGKSVEKEKLLREIRTFAQTDVAPCLSNLEVEDLLESHKIATVWMPKMFYKHGDKIQPITKNGHLYECVRAGMSGEIEPEFFGKLKSRTYEGNSLIWEECAIDDGNLYDVRAAIYEAWIIKAGKASSNFDMRIGDNHFSRSQIYEHCKTQAKSFAPMEF